MAIDQYILKEQVIRGEDIVSPNKAMIAIPDDLGFPGVWVQYNYTEKPDFVFEEDTHECDEVLSFFGGNPADISEFDAEIEVYVEGERYLVTEPTTFRLPAGTKHGPITYLDLKKPVVQVAIQFPK